LTAANVLPSAATVNENFTEWRKNGFPTAVREAWIRGGQPEEMLTELASVFRSPNWPSEIPSIEISLRKMSDALMRVVGNAQEESSAIFAGFDPNASPQAPLAQSPAMARSAGSQAIRRDG
jgi:hypothetical protein